MTAAGLRNWPRRFGDAAQALLPEPLRDASTLAIDAARRWIDAGGPQLGASIAFYTMFSIAPLLVVTIAIAGAVFGADAARGQIVAQIEELVGNTAAQAIETMVASAWLDGRGGFAAAIGVVTLLVGATGVFGELRRALNAIAQIVPTRSPIGALVRVRLTAFALLLAIGFLAIASLLLSAAIAGATGHLSALYPGLSVLAALFDLAVSVAVLSVAFAALLRWLPDQSASRRGVWVAAIAAALLFSLGKTLIGLYLGRASVASSYGAAGSFVVLMLWVYYSSQILLYGAALGRAYDERRLVAGDTP